MNRKNHVRFGMILVLALFIMPLFSGTEYLDWQYYTEEDESLKGEPISPMNDYVRAATDLDVEVAADSDDDFWRSDTGHDTNEDDAVFRNMTASFDAEAQIRLQLNIAKDSTIHSANVSIYLVNAGGGTAYVQRIDEDDVGPLEDDSVQPTVTLTNQVSFSPGVTTGVYVSANVTDMVQDQVSLAGWSSGNYIGLRFVYITIQDVTTSFEDYEAAGTNHAYMNISYTAASENPIDDPPEQDYDYTLNVSVAADGDDDWWRYNESGPTWTHYVDNGSNSDFVNVRNTTDAYGFDDFMYGQMRFQLDIPTGCTVGYASLYLYLSPGGNGNETVNIRRIDEINVGPLESDSGQPPDATDLHSATIYAGEGTGWVSSDNLANMIQDHIDTDGWATNQYMGVQLTVDNPSQDAQCTWYDYQNSTYPPAYLYVIFTNTTVDWLDGWQYRKKYVMDMLADGDVNRTVPVFLYEGDGSDGGIYGRLNYHANEDFSDVRFASDNGTLLLPYYMNQSVSGTSEDYFSDIGVEGNWYDTNSPAAYYDVDTNRTYVVLHGDLGPEGDLDPHICYYDHDLGVWSSIYWIADSPLTDWQGGDTHGSPCLWVDNDGYIHVLYGSHASKPILHAVSDSPNDITSFSAGTQPVYVTTYWNPSYPAIQYDEINDVVHLIYRGTNDEMITNGLGLVYQNSTDDGDTWSTPQEIVSCSNVSQTRPYHGLIDIDRSNWEIIHFAWLNHTKIPSEIAGADYGFFHAYLNVTNGHLYNMTGYDFGTNINETEVLSCRVWEWPVVGDDNGGGSRNGYPDVKLDLEGNPYILAYIGNDSISIGNPAPSGYTTIFIWWNSTTQEWNDMNITARCVSGNGGDMIVYNSTYIVGFMTSYQADNDVHRYTWNGSAWAWQEELYGATISNLVSMTQVPQKYFDGNRTELQVIFTEFDVPLAEGMRGWAWGSSGIVQRTSQGYKKYNVKIVGNFSLSGQTIYVYYGNETATSRSGTLSIDNPPDPSPLWWGPETEDASIYEFVDINTSDEDGSSNLGTQSSFVSQKDWPDSVYDTLTEEDTGEAASHNEDVYDSERSNIDGSSDVGTETNPSYANDSINSQYMNIEEEDLGTVGGSEWLVCNAFDSTYTAWSLDGTSPYLHNQDGTDVVWEKTGDLDAVGWFDFPSTIQSGTLTVNISVYCRNNDGVGDDYADVIVDWTGGSGVDYGDVAQHSTWSFDTISIGSLTPAQVNSLRVRFVFHKVGAADTVVIDYLRVGVISSDEPDYELDFEYWWKAGVYGQTNEEVCIYVGSGDSVENLTAWEWTGSTWSSLGTVDTIGWNNFTCSYLTVSNYYIKLNDTDQNDETSQSSWNIDLILLHTWDVATPNYELNIEEQWTSVYYVYDNEYLCIYTGSMDSDENITVEVWHDSAWTQLTDHLNASTWNNISVHSWLDSSEFTIRFLGANETGDSGDQDSWEIDTVLLWHYPSLSEAPELTDPYCANIDDTDNMYAKARDYQIVVNITDANGAGDVAYVNVSLYSNDQVTEYWRVWFNNSDDTFAEVDTNGYIYLNTSASDVTKSGVSLDLTFIVEIDWDHPDISDTDAKIYANDSNDDNVTEWAEVNWEVETRLDMSSGPILDDNSYTADRGDIDGAIYGSGTVVYYGGTVHPPAGEIDVWVSASEYGAQSGPWNATDYANDGAFNATVYADDEVGQDTYTFKAVIQDAGAGATDLMQSTQQDTYIADQLVFYDSGVDDGRIDVDAYSFTWWNVSYAYDNVNLTSGLNADLNGSKTLDYNGTHWYYNETKSSVQLVGYGISSASENIYGITNWTQTASNTSVIWDQIQILTTTSDDDRIDYDTQAIIAVTAQLEYDNHALGSGDTLYMNGTIMSWNGTHFVLNPQFAAVGLWNFYVNSSSASEVTYGITVVNLDGNNVNQIWDRIQILTTVATDGRIDYGTSTVINVTAQLEYDSHTLGSADTLYMNDTLMTWDTDHFYLTTGSYSIVDLINYFVNSSNANEDTYGITVINLDGNNDDVIWDRIKILTTTSDDGRIDISTAATLVVTAELEYDSHALGTGDTLYMNDTSMSWNTTHFTFGPNFAAVNLWNFFVNSSNANEATYGITVVNLDGNSVNQIWDRIQILTTLAEDGRIDYGTSTLINVTAQLEYDSHALGSGDTLYMNDTLMLWNTDHFNFTTGAYSIVGLINYYVNSSNANEVTYGISVVNLDGNNVDVIWDRIKILTTVATDGRIDYGTSTTVNVTAELEYDSHALGTLDTLYMNDTSMTWDTDHFYLTTGSYSIVDLISYFVNSTNANEDDYGITVVSLNGQDADVIWDRIVIDIQADDESPINDIQVDFTLTVTYEYDSATCTTYTIQIDRNATNWYTFTNANKSLFNDTNSDVTYVYNGSASGDGVSESTYGLSVFTTNDESVTWSPTSNVPVNESTPTLQNPDDTDNMYAKYRFYEVTTNHSDGDGYDDIHMVLLLLWDDGQSTNYWTLKWLEDTNTSSVVNGSGYLTLLYCSNVSSGNWLNITWSFKIDWDHPDLTDIDIKLFVNDTGGESDIDWYEPNWDVETRLDYSVEFNMDDNDAVVDRGSIDYDIYGSGTLIYYGSGDDYPLGNETDVWVACSEYGTNVGPWSDLTYTNGQFNVTCYADDVVGLDTYWVYPVVEGEGSGGTKLNQSSESDTYISDRIIITADGYVHPDSRAQVGENVTFWASAELEYDNHPLGSGDILRFGGKAMTWNGTHFTNGTYTKNEPGEYEFTGNITGSYETTYGIIALQNNPVNMTFDRILIYSMWTDEADQWGNYGSEIYIWASLVSEYDNESMTVGLVQVNGTLGVESGGSINMTYDSISHWNKSYTYSQVVNYTFIITWANWTTYNITEINYNGWNVTYLFQIWDRIKILTTTTDDGRINYDTQASIAVTAELEYNSHALGSGDSLYMNDTLMTWNTTHFVLTPQFAAIDLWNFFVNSSNANEATYGITVVNLDSNDVDQIWDQLIVKGYMTNSTDNRDDVDDYFNISIWIQYDYDDANVTDGTITVNGNSTTYKPGGNWTWTITSAAVGDAIFNSAVAAGNTYGITSVNQDSKTVTVIWDRLIIDIQADSESVDNDVQVNFTLTITYDYSDSACTTYTIQLDRNHSLWYVFTNSNKTLCNDTGNEDVYLYNATSDGDGVGETTYGLTVFTTNTEQVIWSAAATPVNESGPTIQNADDTDNLYARYKFYIIISNVSDPGGFANIDTVLILLYNDTQTENYWTLMFNNTDNSFSIVNGSTYLALASWSSYEESGNTLNITWIIKTSWLHPSLTDIDMKQFVNDTASDSDTDWYESNWDTEARMDYSVSPNTDDNSGTVDRGDLDGTFYTSGTIIYYGSGDDNPLDNETDVWVSGSEYGASAGPWSDLTYSNGEFNVTCYADDVVGQDTYTIKVVTQAGGPGGSDLYYTTSFTGTYIADVLTYLWKFDNYDEDKTYPTLLRNSIDVSPRHILFIYYAYDHNFVNDSTATVKLWSVTSGWYSAGYSSGNGYWAAVTAETVSSAQDYLYNYDDLNITETLHGLSQRQGQIYFDGAMDAITWAYGSPSSEYNVGSNFTIMVKFYPQYKATNAYLFSFKNNTDDGRFYVYLNKHNTTHFSIFFSDDDIGFVTLYDAVSSDYPAYDEWHTLVLRLSGSTFTWWLDDYTNSQSIVAAPGDDDLSVILGGDKIRTQNYKGYINEFAVIDRGLDDIEIEYGLMNGTWGRLFGHGPYIYGNTDTDEVNLWVTEASANVSASDANFFYDFTSSHNYGTRYGDVCVVYNSTAGDWVSVYHIWDRVNVSIVNDTSIYLLNEESAVLNLTLTYEFDSVVLVDYQVLIYRNSTSWTWFTESNYSYGAFTDAQSSTRYNYSATATDAYYIDPNVYSLDEWFTTTVTFTWSARPDVVYSGVSPPDPYDDESIVLSALVDLDMYPLNNVWFKALTSPAAFPDIWYIATESQEGLYNYTFSSMVDGDYGFKVVVGDIYYNSTLDSFSVIVFTVRQRVIIVTNILYTETDTELYLSGRVNMDCNYTVYDNDAYQISGTKSEGAFLVSWDKLVSVGIHNWSIKFNVTNGDYTWVNGSYEVTEPELMVTNVIVSSNLEIVQLSGYVNLNCDYEVFTNDTSEDSGSLSIGSFSILWMKETTVALHSWGVKFNVSSTVRWVNGSYYVSNATLIISDTLYTSNEQFNYLSGTTNVACAYNVYENETSVDNGPLTAGSFSIGWTRNSTDGLIVWGISFSDGVTTRWVNGSYYNEPAVEEDLMVTGLSFTASTEEITVFIQTNWDNTTIYMYDNDSLMTSGPEGTLSYTNPQTVGLHQVGCNVDGGADSFWVNFSYSVGAEAEMYLTAVNLDVSGPIITGFVTTNWGNATLTLYEEDVQKDTDSEGNTLSYTRTVAAGDYDVALKVDGGNTIMWVNSSYTVGGTIFLVTNVVVTGDSSIVHVSCYANMAGNYYVYSNDSYISVSGSFTVGSVEVMWSRNTTVGLHSWGVKFNVSDTTTRWINGSYDVSPSTFLITSVIVSTNDQIVQLSGYANLGCDYEVFSNDSSKDSGSLLAGSLSIDWAKETAVGLHSWGVKFNVSTTIRWVNGSYYVGNITLVISDTVYIGNEDHNYLSGTTNIACDYYVYENESQKSTGPLVAGSFSIDWDRNTTAGLIIWGIRFYDGVTTRWVNGSYYNEPTTYDDLMITEVTFTVSNEEVVVFIQTNWDNTSVYVYDNDTLKDNGIEGILSYDNPQTIGLHRVGCYVDGTAQGLWLNFTYNVGGDAEMYLTGTLVDTSGYNVSAFATTNWGNATLALYEDDVLKDTGAEGVSLSYVKSTGVGDYNVSLKVDGGITVMWVNVTYTIAATVFQVTDVVVTGDISVVHVSCYANDAGSYTVYTNDSYVSDGTYVAGSVEVMWSREADVGLHQWGIKFNITDGSTIWVNGSYDISDTIFLVTDIVVTGDSTTVHVSCYATVAGNYYVYSNDSYKSVSGSFSAGNVEVTWVRETDVGLHSWGVKLNITSGVTRWINGSYDVTSSTFLISDVVVTSTVGEVSVSVYANLAGNYYVYSNDSYKSVTAAFTAGSVVVTWSKESAEALHRWGVKFNESGGVTRWINGSYLVSVTTFEVSSVVVTDTTGEISVSAYATVAGNYYVYSNDSYISVSGAFSAGSVVVTWSKNSTIGLHRWAIKYNTTGGVIRWVNGSYDVSATTFLISNIILSTNDQIVQISGFSNLDCDYEIFSNDTSKDSGSVSAGTFSVNWAKELGTGLYVWGIKFNVSGVTRWVNGSYYVSSTYAWCYIALYGSNGLGLDTSLFKIYVNGSFVPISQFYNRTDLVYNITILNYFDEVVAQGYYEVSSDRLLEVQISIFAFKVYNQMDDEFIYFNMTSSGGATWSEHIGPRKVVTFYLYGGNFYTYTFTALGGPDPGVHTGSLRVTVDTGVIISGFDLVRIYNGISNVGGGGKVSVEDLAVALSAVQGDILTQVQFFSWLTVLLLFIGLYAIPFIKRKGHIRGAPDVPEPSGLLDFFDEEPVSSKKRKKKAPVPKQLKEHTFKEGPLNPQFKGKRILDDMGENIWKKLRKGKR